MKRSKIKSKRLRDALDNPDTYRGGRTTPKDTAPKPSGSKPKPPATAAKPSDGQNLRSGRKPASTPARTTPAKPKPKPAAAKPSAPKPKPRAATPKPAASKPKPSAQRNTGSGRDGSFGAGTSGSGRPSDPNPKPRARTTSTSSPNRRSLRDRLLGTREERQRINEQGRQSAATSAELGRQRRESKGPKTGETRTRRINGQGGRKRTITEVYRNGRWVRK